MFLSRHDVEQAGVRESLFVEGSTHYKGREIAYRKAWVLSRFWLFCDPDDLGFTPHMTTLREGFWEAWITHWISRNVRPDSNCIDLGANMGYYSMLLAGMGCNVYAIEPQPHLADLIYLSAAENHYNVSVHRMAVSDQNGQFTMRVPTGHGMNASLAYEPLSPHGYTEIEVPVTRLDDFGSGFDFIKVDVEGAEDRVFDGAQNFISKNPDCTWLLEWRADRMESPERSAEKIFERMHVSYVEYDGYEVPLITPQQLHARQHEDWMLVLRPR